MDTTVGLWDVAGGELLAQLSGHTGGVFGVGFSPDAAFAVSSAQDGTLIVWDLTAGEALREMRGHAGAAHWAGFSPDGTRLLSAGEDGLLRWWDPLLGLDDLLDWAAAHRFVSPLPCDQQLKYGLVETCGE
jgi:WD40 repeat protein